jgi:hypothetical protein
MFWRLEILVVASTVALARGRPRHALSDESLTRRGPSPPTPQALVRRAGLRHSPTGQGRRLGDSETAVDMLAVGKEPAVDTVAAARRRAAGRPVQASREAKRDLNL